MGTKNIKLPYLCDKSWQAITREERYFCAELYQQLKQPEHLRTFLGLINDGMRIRTDVPHTVAKLNTDPNAWEVGYEVALYRDVVYALGHKADGKPPYEIGTSGFSKKRTFDFCLFSADRIVVIEAKVCAGLDGDQLGKFAVDRDNISRLLTKSTLEVIMVGLWSDRYRGKLDTRKGKNYDGIREQVTNIFDSVVHWSALSGKIASPANELGVDLWELADGSNDRKPGELPLKGKITWTPSCEEPI